MKAGMARQSKAEQSAGHEDVTPENEIPVSSDGENLDSAKRRSIAAPVTSVSWRRGLLWSAAAALVGGFVLRVWMLHAFPQVSGDALIYGNIAKSLVLHGQFAITDGSGAVHPTLIRLPGYPLFLAACFRIFGIDNYNAVAYFQIILELGACFLLAGFVRRIFSPSAGLITLWLATMCPFTAVYAFAPLTESPTFDMICVALWSLERHLSESGGEVSDSGRRKWRWLFVFTVAVSCAALLRPDGALLAIALWPALLLDRSAKTSFSSALRQALICGLFSILPFVVWTGRNWHTFHVFEPLAPRYANDPGEDPHLGWQHWVKTWCVDFSCTYEVYWNVPDGPLAMEDLPSQAVDSAAEREQTTALLADYNIKEELSPDIDARFGELARQRAAANPFRTYLWLPLGRLADMTLRPRVENLPIDLRWWEYNHHRQETRFSIAYGAVNLIFLLLGLAGFLYRPRFWPYMAAYFVLRGLLLLTIEAPETRYTLEFFPFLFALGGIALHRFFSRGERLQET